MFSLGACVRRACVRACASVFVLFACLNVVVCVCVYVERGSLAVECRTRNQVSPGSNPPLLPFRRLGIFVLSIGAPVDSAI